MKSIVVSVDYHDLLKITLEANHKHFEETLVVTAPHDKETQRLCELFPRVRCFITDTFYRFGAQFNKGLAMELGFTELGREGWIVVWDADVLMPDNIGEIQKFDGHLIGIKRKIATVPEEFNFEALKNHNFYGDVGEIPGYFQLFNAEDAALKGKKYWYGVDWRHAGGCDSYFQSHWPHEKRIFIDGFWCIHYGKPGVNWCGRLSPFLDGSMPEAWRDRQKKQNQIFIDRSLYGITEREKITKEDL